MIEKLLWAVIPCCIISGPFFMTRIAGSAAPSSGDRLVTEGVYMLSFGLAGIFWIMATQQKRIRALEAKLSIEA